MIGLIITLIGFAYLMVMLYQEDQANRRPRNFKGQFKSTKKVIYYGQI